MYNHILFVTYWAISSIFLTVGKILSFKPIDLGNSKYGMSESALYGGFFLTFWIWICWDVMIVRKITPKGDILAVLVFGLINFFGLVLGSILDRFTGFRLSNYVYGLGGGIILAGIQRLVYLWIIRPR